MAKRIQLSRKRGWKMPENTVRVDRSTRFGNPFTATDHGRAKAIYLYRQFIAGELGTALHPYLLVRRRKILDGLAALKGKNLACSCRLSEPCHADVLLELANPNQGGE